MTNWTLNKFIKTLLSFINLTFDGVMISDNIWSKFWKVTLFELTLRNQSPILIFLFFIASPSGINPATITLTLSENAFGMIPKYASHKVALLPNLCLLSGSIHNVTWRVSPALYVIKLFIFKFFKYIFFSLYSVSQSLPGNLEMWLPCFHCHLLSLVRLCCLPHCYCWSSYFSYSTAYSLYVWLDGKIYQLLCYDDESIQVENCHSYCPKLYGQTRTDSPLQILCKILLHWV